MVNKTPEKTGSFYKILFSKTWFYYLCFAVLLLVVFSQFIFSDMMLYSSDQMGGLDSKVFMKNSIEKFKQLPLWFNTRLSGMPTVDAMFGDVFYPPSLIMNLLLPVHRAIGMKMIFHVFLAGALFFLMMRKGFKCSPFLSFVSGTFYMLNPQFLTLIYGGHDGKMYVIALLPFVIWRLKALMEISSIRNASFLGFGIGTLLLTSHIQMTYFVLWGLFFYWIVTSVMFFVQKKPISRVFSLAGCFWLAVFIGMGIGFIQLLPSYMYVKDAFSVRGVGRGFEYASSWSMHWPEIFSLWVPEFVNSLDYYWGQNPFKLNSEYAGSIALLLGVLAVIRKPGVHRYFWAGFSIFALLFSLGAHSFIFQIAYYIVPGVSKFRAASMITFWFSFGSILLAGLFLKDVLEGKLSTMTEESQKKWSKGILIAVAGCAAVALLFSSKGFVRGLFNSVLMENGKEKIFDINFSEQFVPFLWLWLFFTLSTLLLLLGVIKNSVKPKLFVAVIFIFGIIDVLRIDIGEKKSLYSPSKKVGFVQLINPAGYFNSEEPLVNLSKEMNTEPFRCYSLPGALPQNGEGIHGLEGVNGFHDNELRWYRDYRGDQQDRNYISSLIGMADDGQAYLKVENLQQGNAFLNLANVKYYLIRTQGKLLTMKNENALGRISFASNYVVMDSSKILESLKNGSYDYRTTIALTTEPDVKPQNTGSMQGNFSVSWKTYSPNYRKADVFIPADGFLRVSETYYPGWEIRVDGKKTKYYQADYSWMAVPVAKGNHVIEMIPHSMFLSKAAGISGVILFILFVYWLMLVILNNKGKNVLANKGGNISVPMPSKAEVETEY